MTEVYCVTVYPLQGPSWVVFRTNLNAANRTAAKEWRNGAHTTIDLALVADDQWQHAR